jgi:Cu2+-exporting ATPase
MTFAALVAGQSMIFGLAVSMSPPAGTARLAIHGTLMVSAIVVFALTGGPLLREAWSGLKQRRIVLEQFFLAGIFGAFGASLYCTITGVGNIYYEVVAVLLAIYTFGKIVLARQRRHVLQAAEILGGEFDRCEVVQPDGSRRTVAAGDIRKGDLIFVQQGGRFRQTELCARGLLSCGRPLSRARLSRR